MKMIQEEKLRNLISSMCHIYLAVPGLPGCKADLTLKMFKVDHD